MWNFLNLNLISPLKIRGASHRLRGVQLIVQRSDSRRGVIKNNGFTMLELVVVFAIIGILATIGIPNFKKFQANQALKESVQLFETELGSAFSSARSHPKNYKIKLQDGSNNTFEVFEIAPSRAASTSTKIFSLSGGTTVKIGTIRSMNSNNSFEIIFDRPYGDIQQKNSSAAYIPITLQSPTGDSFTIKIYTNSGLITHQKDEN